MVLRQVENFSTLGKQSLVLSHGAILLFTMFGNIMGRLRVNDLNFTDNLSLEALLEIQRATFRMEQPKQMLNKLCMNKRMHCQIGIS